MHPELFSLKPRCFLWPAQTAQQFHKTSQTMWGVITTYSLVKTSTKFTLPRLCSKRCLLGGQVMSDETNIAYMIITILKSVAATGPNEIRIDLCVHGFSAMNRCP